MIITCPCGDKKFKVDANLIPKDGRLLQCSGCGHKWHYIQVLDNEIEFNEEKVNLSENLFNDEFETDENLNKTINDKSEKLIEEKIIKKTTNRINYLKITLVLIISLVALILALDTFKFQISNLIPGFEVVMENLYETFLDIKLFVIDLITND